MAKPYLRCTVLLFLSLLGQQSRGLAQAHAPKRWITAWGASPENAATTPVSNATVRMIARVTAAGDAVRIRLDNTFGAAPLTIGQAYIGERVQGARVALGSSHKVTFQGSVRVIIPAGGRVESDPVTMKVSSQQDLAVSMFIPETNVLPSQHSRAQVTSYQSQNNSGDLSAVEDPKPFTGTTTAMLWLRAIDVLTTSSSSLKGVVVAFGDSITDGTCTTVDGHDRWEDWMAVRLDLARGISGGVPKSAMPASTWAVINEGIGGNTISGGNFPAPPRSTPGVERLDRDVFSHSSVTHVIVFMGTNDLRRGASAAQVIAGMQDIIERAHKRRLKVFGVTVLPRQNRVPLTPAPATPYPGGRWDESMTMARHEVNRWIRTQARFDAVIDFDEVVRDPANPELMLPRFDCGDNVHPSPAGYYEMGRSVKLDLLQSPRLKAARGIR
jgi:lysophospholipase L1-like esterase